MTAWRQGDLVRFADDRRRQSWEVVHAGELWLSLQRLRPGHAGQRPLTSVRVSDAPTRLRAARRTP